MIPADKANHYILGQIVAVLALVISNNITLTLYATVAVAAGKEIYDMTGRGTPEVLDALYTVAGGLVPILLVLFL